jgi:6-phospho-3-hexuloisomerase
MSATLARLDTVLAEMRAVFAAAPDAVDQLAREIQNARRIAIYGIGRNGLVLQAFAMRLMHLGIDAHFVGQLAAPPVASGDLVIAAVALGRLPTADAVLAAARTAKARTLVVTARPKLVEGADAVIDLPAQTMAEPPNSILPLGSAFELALSLLCDLTVVELMKRIGRTNADLLARHANLL